MSELLNAALEYASKGWPIFPCRSDKSPYTKHGVLDATTNKQEIREWWDHWPRANIGLDVAGAGMVVVDLDPGYDPKELKNNVGDLPDTQLSSRTPRGGTHLFYAIKTDEFISPSGSKVARKVDIRSFHSYVLLEPSVTSDGEYSWINEGKPAFRTDRLVEVANSHRDKHEDRDNWLIEADLDENITLAIEWLKKDAQIAIEGQGGDTMAYKTAAHMKSFGISPELAFDLIWEHWNPRCIPPWNADDVEHLTRKVENGYTYNTSPPGNITPAYKVARSKALFKPVTVELPSGNEYQAGRYRIVDRSGMEHIRSPGWIIDGFLPKEAYAILFGAYGTFKTFVALDIALSIATGFPIKPVWPGIVKPGKVLFAAGEGRSSITNRIKAWERVHWAEEKAENFYLCDPVPHVSEEIEPFLEVAQAASPQGYSLVVIDTIGRAMQGVNENHQENASAFTAMVECIKRELNCSVLCLHHTGHENKDRERGSVVFGADADTRVLVERQEKAYRVDLHMVKQKDAPEWNNPVEIHLNEIRINGTKEASLVACTPEQRALTHTKEEPLQVNGSGHRSGKRGPRSKINLAVLERAIIEVLRSNRAREWSQKDLAEAVAMHETIDGVSSKTLAQHHMTDLREDSTSAANYLYDPAKKKWRWSQSTS